MAGTPRRYERFEARIAPEQKAKLRRAAVLTGESLSDFVMSAAEREADATIRQHEMIDLSARDSLLLAEALLNPPAPTAAAAAAWEEYQRFRAGRV